MASVGLPSSQISMRLGVSHATAWRFGIRGAKRPLRRVHAGDGLILTELKVDAGKLRELDSLWNKSFFKKLWDNERGAEIRFIGAVNSMFEHSAKHFRIEHLTKNFVCGHCGNTNAPANIAENPKFCNRRCKGKAMWKRQKADGRTKIWAKRKLLKPVNRIIKSHRNRIQQLCKRGAMQKQDSILKLIGCTRSELRTHLERQFKAGMSWDNYGREWHVDHKRPIASFDLTRAEEQAQCFHYSNLQPLHPLENMQKSDTWTQ